MKKKKPRTFYYPMQVRLLDKPLKDGAIGHIVVYKDERTAKKARQIKGVRIEKVEEII